MPLPTGPFFDPMAMPLDGCTTDGLDVALGRWHVPSVGYPRIEAGGCGGYRRTGETIDLDPRDDGATYQSWSDGTRLITYEHYRTPATGEIAYEHASAFAACVVEGTGLLTIHGVQTRWGDPESPQLPASFVTDIGVPFGPRDGLARNAILRGSLGSWGDPPTPIHGIDVAVDGGIAYVVGWNGLDVVDVGDPERPLHLAHAGSSYNDVAIVHRGGRIYAVAAAYPTDIFDVTRPSAPVRLLPIPAYSHTVQIAVDTAGRTLLYLGGNSSIPIFDITDPRAAIALGEVPIPTVFDVHDLAVDGTMLYVNATSGGLFALDVAGGFDTPIERGRLDTDGYSHSSAVGVAGGRRVVLHGDESTPNGYLRILDGDPASPTFLRDIGEYRTRAEVSIHNFQLVGDRVYIAYYQDGLRVVDLSDPTQPIELAHYNTWDDATAFGASFEGAFGVHVVDGRTYVADDLRGLLVIDSP